MHRVRSVNAVSRRAQELRLHLATATSGESSAEDEAGSDSVGEEECRQVEVGHATAGTPRTLAERPQGNRQGLDVGDGDEDKELAAVVTDKEESPPSQSENPAGSGASESGWRHGDRHWSDGDAEPKGSIVRRAVEKRSAIWDLDEEDERDSRWASINSKIVSGGQEGGAKPLQIVAQSVVRKKIRKSNVVGNLSELGRSAGRLSEDDSDLSVDEGGSVTERRGEVQTKKVILDSDDEY